MASKHLKPQKQPQYLQMTELANTQVGGKILFATDEWFAPASCLLKPEPPEWREGVYTDFGKWMDGWESRRKRTPGHDWCIIQLGICGVIYGVDVDTSYFTGNYAPRISIQAAYMPEWASDSQLQRDILEAWPCEMGSKAGEEELEAVSVLRSEEWEEIVRQTPMRPGYVDTCHNYIRVNHNKPVTHLRLNMFPDGGIARLRVYGEVSRDWSRINAGELIDLVSLTSGAVPVGWSDTHFGHPVNLLKPTRGINMGDGWETARRLDRPAILEADDLGHLKVPGCEWAVIQLGIAGKAEVIEVDTNHFRGNFPESFLLEGCVGKIAQRPTVGLDAQLCEQLGTWHVIVPRTKLKANKRHQFVSMDQEHNFTHVRLTIYPDGGVSRLRVYGRPDPTALQQNLQAQSNLDKTSRAGAKL